MTQISLLINKSTHLQIDTDRKEATLNSKKISLDVDGFARKLLPIVSSWEHKMINNFILDGLSYSVTIIDNGKESKYEGKNKFPKNFNEFTGLLEDYEIL